jgi:hypothetical protein
MRMDVDDLDAAILSHARERWLKAAMVASRATQDCGLGLSDEQFDIVVARGRLVAQGNLCRPRFSEVRRPGGADVDRAPRRDLRP